MCHYWKVDDIIIKKPNFIFYFKTTFRFLDKNNSSTAAFLVVFFFLHPREHLGLYTQNKGLPSEVFAVYIHISTYCLCPSSLDSEIKNYNNALKSTDVSDVLITDRNKKMYR